MSRRLLIEFDTSLAVGLDIGQSFELAIRRSLIEPRRHPEVYLLGRRFGTVVNPEEREANVRKMRADAIEMRAIHQQIVDDFDGTAKQATGVAKQMVESQIRMARHMVLYFDQQLKYLEIL
jgi:hypothetical protein